MEQILHRPPLRQQQGNPLCQKHQPAAAHQHLPRQNPPFERFHRVLISLVETRRGASLLICVSLEYPSQKHIQPVG